MPIFTATLHGVTGRVLKVTHEHNPRGLDSLAFPQLREVTMRELRVRVLAALSTVDAKLAGAYVVGFSAPGVGPVAAEGMGLDLPAALALLDAPDAARDVGAIGELSLGGEVRAVRGVLPMVEALRDAGVSEVLVAPENAREALLVPGVRVRAVPHLRDALRVCANPNEPVTVFSNLPPVLPSLPDFKDIRGMVGAKRALEIAAVGGHSILLVGGPGAGKTMLARRLSSILPPMPPEEALEVTRVLSAAGLNVGGGLVTARPFRAPHHSCTPAGLVGGGTPARPGEASLAHNGVLFLDQIEEFSRPALEYLATVVREGVSVLSRASGTLRFPARFQLVCAASPCPCGRRFVTRGCGCSCSEESLRRYDARIEQVCALLGIQMVVRIDAPDVLEEAPTRDPSSQVAERVVAARGRLPRVSLYGGAAAASVPFAARPSMGIAVMSVATSCAALADATSVGSAHLGEALQLAAPGVRELIQQVSP